MESLSSVFSEERDGNAVIAVNTKTGHTDSEEMIIPSSVQSLITETNELLFHVDKEM